MDENANAVIDPEYRVVIVEEPAPRSIRFRYSSEGRTAGSLQGANSTERNETFPSIKIEGYTGVASIMVILVTNSPPYKVHPHRLVGEKCDKGVYYLRKVKTNKENPTVITFRKLGIQCVKKREITESLSERERLGIDPFKRGFHHNDLDLGSVRLCFLVILKPYPSDLKRKIQLQPVVSQPIYNKKFPVNLSIIDISATSSPACGSKKIMIFCDKVSKDDIRVRFFEKGTNWVDWGRFHHSNVHRQVGITFETPNYRLQDICQAVNVFIQLERPSDRVRSEPIPFQYIPDVNNINVNMKLKEAKINHTKDFLSFILDSVEASTSQNPAQNQQQQTQVPTISQSQFQNDENNQQQQTQVPTVFQSENDDYIQQLQNLQIVDDVDAWYYQNPPQNDDYYRQLQDMVVTMQQVHYHGNLQQSQDLQSALSHELPQTLPQNPQNSPQSLENPQQMQCLYIQHSQEQFNQQPQYDHEMQPQGAYAVGNQTAAATSAEFNVLPQQHQYVQPYGIQPGFQNNQYQHFDAEGFPVPDGNVMSGPVELAQPNPKYNLKYNSPYNSPY